MSKDTSIGRLAAAFAKAITKFRVQRGISQDDFARALGLAPAFYRELEAATRPLPIALIEELAIELRCTPEELINAAQAELTTPPPENTKC